MTEEEIKNILSSSGAKKSESTPSQSMGSKLSPEEAKNDEDLQTLESIMAEGMTKSETAKLSPKEILSRLAYKPSASGNKAPLTKTIEEEATVEKDEIDEIIDSNEEVSTKKFDIDEVMGEKPKIENKDEKSEVVQENQKEEPLKVSSRPKSIQVASSPKPIQVASTEKEADPLTYEKYLQRKEVMQELLEKTEKQNKEGLLKGIEEIETGLNEKLKEINISTTLSLQLTLRQKGFELSDDFRTIHVKASNATVQTTNLIFPSHDSKGEPLSPKDAAEKLLGALGLEETVNLVEKRLAEFITKYQEQEQEQKAEKSSLFRSLLRRLWHFFSKEKEPEKPKLKKTPLSEKIQKALEKAGLVSAEKEEVNKSTEVTQKPKASAAVNEGVLGVA